MAELRYVDWDGLVYYDGKIKDFIQSNAENYLKMGGILPVKDLPDPSRQNLNYIYKITDSFTSDNHFEEPGYIYPAGTWVQCINHEEDERWLYTIFNEETIGNTADLSDYYTKSEVNEKIEEAIASIEIPEIDPNNYYTKEEVNTLIPDVSGLATKEELEAVQNVAGSNSVKLMQIDSDLVDINQKLETIPSIEGLATETYVDEKFAEIVVPDVSGLVTKEELEDAINNIEHPTVDLSDYYTKAEVDEAIANIEHPTVNLDGYATEDWVNEQGFLKEHQDLSEYAKKSEVPSIEGLATEDFVKSEIAKAELNGGEVTEEELDKLLANYYNKSEVNALIPQVPTKVSELTNDAEFITEDNLSDYAKRDELFSKDYNDLINTPVIPSVEGLATEQFVKDEIAKVEHPTVDLTGYAKESWVNEQGFIKDIPSEYITESELDAKGYLTEHQDLSEYAKKSDIPEAELFVINFNDPNFAEALEAYNSGKLLILTNAAPDANGYAVMNYVRDDMITFTKFLTSRSETYGSFNTYYLHSDNTWEVSSEVKLNKVEANVSDAADTDLTSIRIGKEVYRLPETDLSEYYTKTEVDTKFENIEHPSLEGYATEQWVKDELAKIDPSIPSEYITETELLEKGYITAAALTDYAKADSIPTKTSQLTNDSNFLTEHQDISGKADKADLEGLASTDYVDQAIAGIPQTDVSNLATKSELEAVEEKIPTDYLTTVPEEYVTKTELDAEGFVKSLDGYATEQFVTDCISNIKHPDPDLSNYFTKDETTSAINEAIEGIDIPEVNLDPYATKAQVAEQVATKADKVPFTTDMFVTDAQGGFVVGDNLNGMSITDILAKLLGLQPTITPEEPDEPDVPQTIVEKIMSNNLSMYQVNELSESIEIPYSYVTYTDENYADAPTNDCFYQYTNSSGITESGYQHVSDENDSMYYLIALPQGVNFNENVSVKVWDETSNTWADVTDTLEMSSDLQFIEESLVEADISMPTIPEGYTLWIDSSLNTCTGSDYRFIINE